MNYNKLYRLENLTTIYCACQGKKEEKKNHLIFNNFSGEIPVCHLSVQK